MISNKKYKLGEIAKDFGLKSNDLVNVLKAHSGGGAVHTSAIDEDDFAVIFEVLTSENQIVGLEDYLAGKTDVLPEHRPKPAEPKKETKKEKTDSDAAKSKPEGDKTLDVKKEEAKSGETADKSPPIKRPKRLTVKSSSRPRPSRSKAA